MPSELLSACFETVCQAPGRKGPQKFALRLILEVSLWKSLTMSA